MEVVCYVFDVLCIHRVEYIITIMRQCAGLCTDLTALVG